MPRRMVAFPNEEEVTTPANLWHEETLPQAVTLCQLWMGFFCFTALEWETGDRRWKGGRYDYGQMSLDLKYSCLKSTRE